MAAPTLPLIEERQSATADLALRYDFRSNQVCAWKKQPLGNAMIARQFRGKGPAQFAAPFCGLNPGSPAAGEGV